MAEYLPRFSPARSLTYTAGEDITGGQLVELTGSYTIGVAKADSEKVVGVAAFDTAQGDKVTVYSGGVQRPTAEGAIKAGDRVSPAANGKVVKGGTAELGIALADAEADAPAEIKFDR